ncbi:hypothetical protein BC629DRAFT_1434941 [Irpex lacteus]|nr:hypothetical protein BC629DRAFT_1434941 [Irpex lacteus]
MPSSGDVRAVLVDTGGQLCQPSLGDVRKELVEPSHLTQTPPIRWRTAQFNDAWLFHPASRRANILSQSRQQMKQPISSWNCLSLRELSAEYGTSLGLPRSSRDTAVFSILSYRTAIASYGWPSQLYPDSCSAMSLRTIHCHESLTSSDSTGFIERRKKERYSTGRDRTQEPCWQFYAHTTDARHLDVNEPSRYSGSKCYVRPRHNGGSVMDKPETFTFARCRQEEVNLINPHNYW